MKRKIVKILLTLSLLLGGCSNIKKDNSNSDSLSKYESYLNTLVEQDRFASSSYYYDISAVLNELADGTVRYDVFVENPQIAMYDIEVLVVESTAKRTDNFIYPCVGIFKNEAYTMIPYQKFEERGYVEAFQLSGISTNKQVVLNVLITWKDYAKLQTFREFIKIIPDASTDGENAPNEEKKEVTDKINPENNVDN